MRWYAEWVGANGGHALRVMIVVVARKLLIAPWQFVSVGVAPAGVLLKTA